MEVENWMAGGREGVARGVLWVVGDGAWVSGGQVGLGVWVRACVCVCVCVPVCVCVCLCVAWGIRRGVSARFASRSLLLTE